MNFNLTIDKAIQIAKQEVKDGTAQVYLNAIPQAIERFGVEGFETQILYAYVNMAYWRGETARQVKRFIKSWLKSKMRI